MEKAWPARMERARKSSASGNCSSKVSIRLVRWCSTNRYGMSRVRPAHSTSQGPLNPKRRTTRPTNAAVIASAQQSPRTRPCPPVSVLGRPVRLKSGQHPLEATTCSVSSFRMLVDGEPARPPRSSAGRSPASGGAARKISIPRIDRNQPGEDHGESRR